MTKVAPVKGTRDFYPPQMAVRNWILEGWRRTSLCNGFVEYDGPIFEHLQLYTQKSGDGIVGELFHLQDRGGRELAIRPEMTPTLARMINQQINALPRPIKWFSLPRCCRAERPQRGRLREFFQWNIDIVGSDAMLADAEVIYTALDYVRSVGLGPADITAKISSRALLAALLLDQGFAPEQLDSVYGLLDKRPKLPDDKFAALAAEVIPDEQQRGRLERIQAVPSLAEIDPLVHTAPARAALAQLRELFGLLDTLGVADYCTFDISIVRGLAYYTGPIFELHDRGGQLRAVGGGGRYDNLLAGLGGPSVSGTGFGMGDVVLELLLVEKGLLEPTEQRLDFFVIDADAALFEPALQLVGQLRQAGWATACDYRRTGIGKQLKQAAALRARCAVILGQETIDANQVTVKDLDQGTQRTVPLDDLVAQPDRFFAVSE